MTKFFTSNKVARLFSFALLFTINNTAFASSTCTVNGQEVPCGELGNKVVSFLGFGFGALVGVCVLKHFDYMLFKRFGLEFFYPKSCFFRWSYIFFSITAWFWVDKCHFLPICAYNRLYRRKTRRYFRRSKK